MRLSQTLSKSEQQQAEERFDDWNGLKQDIHFDVDTDKIPFFHEREIMWIHLGQNVGTEIYGKGDDHMRPVLILKKFKNSFLGVPLTSKVKAKDNPFFFYLGEFGVYREKSWACLSQLRFFDARRIAYKMRAPNKIGESIFDELKIKIRQLCFS